MAEFPVHPERVSELSFCPLMMRDEILSWLRRIPLLRRLAGHGPGGGDHLAGTFFLPRLQDSKLPMYVLAYHS